MEIEEAIVFLTVRTFIAGIMSAATLTCGLALAIAQDETVEITVLADQVRSQGFACSNPSSAERLAKESAPEEPVYLLKCENATYQLRLIPDQAAQVTEIK
jgi:hypothetical protein